MTEAAHTKNIKQCLENDFNIFQEVKGVHIVEKKKVRIDFLIKPKKHVIEAGFDDCWVGIEVKYFDNPKEQIGKVARLLWQSITYQQSEYCIHGENIRPQFVLMASNIDGSDELKQMYRPTLQVANLAMVGSLSVKDSNNWAMGFVSSRYMIKTNGKLRKTNTNAGRGVYIGNSARKRQ